MRRSVTLNAMTKGRRAQIAVVTGILLWLVLGRVLDPLGAVLPAILAGVLVWWLTAPRQPSE